MIAYIHRITVFWGHFLPTVADGADVLEGMGGRVQCPKDILAGNQRQVGEFLMAGRSLKIESFTLSCARERIQSSRPGIFKRLGLGCPDGGTQTGTRLAGTRRARIKQRQVLCRVLGKSHGGELGGALAVEEMVEVQV